MNEQIRKLAKQAITDKLTLDEFINDLKLNPNTYWGFTDSELEKFAELIVRECIDIVADAVDHREPASTYVGKIKQHFGVEE